MKRTRKGSFFTYQMFLMNSYPEFVILLIVNNSLLTLMTTNRPKTKTGQYKAKRKDTKIGTIEKKYGKDFGVRSDKKLGNFLNEHGYQSLNALLRNE